MDDSLLREAQSARDRLNQLEVELDRHRREFHQAVRRLHSAGPSTRDIASALGLSHQRVHQIVGRGKDVAGPDRGGPILKRLVRRRPSDCRTDHGSVGIDKLDKRFSIEARDVLALAQTEAQSLSHSYLGTEHVLLGLIRADASLAGRLLRVMGADLDRSRAAITALLGSQSPPVGDRLTPTARVKEVLELARFEAERLHSPHVRNEHLLLGLAREGRGLGARVLKDLGISYDQLRARIARAAVECSFCGRSGVEVAHLVAGPGVYICDQCVDEAAELPSSAMQPESADSPMKIISSIEPAAACCFCGKRGAAVERLVGVGPQTSICRECLVLCQEIQKEKRRPDWA